MSTDNRISAAEGALRDSTEQLAQDLGRLQHKLAQTETIVRWPKQRINRARHWLDEKLTPEDRRALPRLIGGLAVLWLASRFFR